MMGRITVADFCIRCLNDDKKVRVWNCDEKWNFDKIGTVFEGTLQEAAQSACAYELVGSFSFEDDLICINI